LVPRPQPGAGSLGDDPPAQPEGFAEPPHLSLVEVGDGEDVHATIASLREVTRIEFRPVACPDEESVQPVRVVIEQSRAILTLALRFPSASLSGSRFFMKVR